MREIFDYIFRTLFLLSVLAVIVYTFHLWEHANLMEFQSIQVMHHDAVISKDKIMLNVLKPYVIKSNIWLTRAKYWDATLLGDPMYPDLIRQTPMIK